MKTMLFTLPTCKYCVPAKELLKDQKDIEVINLENNPDLAVKYGIRSVPALVVEKCDGFTTYIGLDKIENYKKEKVSASCCGCR